MVIAKERSDSWMQPLIFRLVSAVCFERKVKPMSVKFSQPRKFISGRGTKPCGSNIVVMHVLASEIARLMMMFIDNNYYIGERLKLEGGTENMVVCTKEREGMPAEFLMATPCTKSLRCVSRNFIQRTQPHREPPTRPNWAL